MNLNYNPKTLHFILETIQIVGAIGTVAGIAGHLYPPLAIVGAAFTAAATAAKPFVVGNVPPSQ